MTRFTIVPLLLMSGIAYAGLTSQTSAPFSIPFSQFSGCQGQSVTSIGYTFTASQSGSCSLLFLSSGPDYTGETMLDDNLFKATQGVLISSGVGPFTAVSIDLSLVFPTGGFAGNVTIVGTRADNSTVSESFFLSSFGINTFTFNSGFSNLVSLQMPPNNDSAVNYFQFGNLEVESDVPEPGTLLLMALGLIPIIRRLT